jgi:hypothetical protein
VCGWHNYQPPHPPTTATTPTAQPPAVRVTDGAASWTVTRRFKNFEALHVRLVGECAHYRDLRLQAPPKHIFKLSQV